MGSKLKRFLSLMLAFMMVLSIVPVSAEDSGAGSAGTSTTEVVATIGETEYYSLTAAFEAAVDGNTIKLEADVDEVVRLSVSDGDSVPSIVLDLNGKTWDCGYGTRINAVTMKITNGTIGTRRWDLQTGDTVDVFYFGGHSTLPSTMTLTGVTFNAELRVNNMAPSDAELELLRSAAKSTSKAPNATTVIISNGQFDVVTVQKAAYLTINGGYFSGIHAEEGAFVTDNRNKENGNTGSVTDEGQTSDEIVEVKNVHIKTPDEFAYTVSESGVTLTFVDYTPVDVRNYMQFTVGASSTTFYVQRLDGDTWTYVDPVSGTSTIKHEFTEPGSVTFRCDWDKNGTYDRLVVLVKAEAVAATAKTGDSIEVDGITYAVTGDTVTVTDGKSASGDVVIPATVSHGDVEYTVVGIASNAFNDANEVTSIVVPDSVTTLGGAAFANMDKLTSLTIGGGVTSWGSKLAVNNYELTTVVIAEGATLIGDLAFRTCPKLANVTLPSTLKTIGATAFAYAAITELVIPASVESIGADSFKDIDTLKKVTFLGENTKLGSTSFQMCDGLEEVILPSKLTAIPQGAFRYCTGLKTIGFPETLTEIGNYSFQGCTSLESVTISKNITNLVTNAFNGCTSLKNLTIEEGFAGTIGGYVFQGCTALESVVIPSSMETVGESMFNMCSSLKNVTLSEGVKTLNISAFANCTALETLTIPASLERMRHGSIANCTSLKTLIITGENLPVIEHSNALDGLSEDIVVIYDGDDALTGNWAALADNVVCYAAAIGEVKYPTLAEAFKAALMNGGTITLRRNVEESIRLAIANDAEVKTITLDLNGKVWDCDFGTRLNGINLTIMGNGSIGSELVEGESIDVLFFGGHQTLPSTLTIKAGVTFNAELRVNNMAPTNDEINLLIASSKSVEEPANVTKVTIEGGTFNAPVMVQKSAYLTIEDGTFGEGVIVEEGAYFTDVRATDDDDSTSGVTASPSGTVEVFEPYTRTESGVTVTFTDPAPISEEATSFTVSAEAGTYNVQKLNPATDVWEDVAPATDSTYSHLFTELGSVTYRIDWSNNGTYDLLVVLEKVEAVASVTDTEGNATYYTTLQQAHKAAADGETIVVLQDIELSESLVVTKTVTLDLNGCTLSQSKECTAHYAMIENQGTLTIEGDGKISFTDTGAGDPDFGWGSYTVLNSGTLVINGGTIEHLGTQSFGKHMICAVQQSAGSTTINGGTISTPNYRSVRATKGNLTITGGTLDGQVWLQPYQGNVTMTVTGGDFSPNGNDGSSIFMGMDEDSYSVTETTSITGGTFNTKIGCSDAEALAGVITGGTFSESARKNTDEMLLEEGFIFAAADESGWYIVREANYVAQVGETKYETIEEAIDAAEAGDTVTVLKDIVLEQGVTIASDDSITLDLAGYTVSMTDETTSTSALITNNGTLKITGEGKLSYNAKTPNTGYSTSTIINNGFLTVENGTFENTTKGGASYVIDNYNTLTVEGGSYRTTGNALRQAQFGNYNNTVTINGGTFTGYASLQMHVFSAAKETTATINGGTFTGSYAVYTTFSDAGVSANTSIVVDGGTFAGKYALFLYNSKIGAYDNAFNAEIKNGYFNGEVCIYAKNAEGTNVDLPMITGGTYTTEPAETIIADGYIAVDNGDDTWTVKKTGVTISNVEELIAFGNAVTGNTEYQGVKVAGNSDVVVKLTADLDLTGSGFVPMGNGSGNTFMGTFDGQGHTISNMTLTCDYYRGVGFFRNLGNGAVIKDLTFDNADINNGAASAANHFYGVVAGFSNNVTLDNVDVKNSSVTCKYAGAVMIGCIEGTSTIKNCDLENDTVRTTNIRTSVYGILGNSASGHTAVLENNTINNVTAIVDGEIKSIRETLNYGDWNSGTEYTESTYVAQIGDTKYSTLFDAVAAAKDGDTIILIGEVVRVETLVVNKEITLDLNGMAVSSTGDMFEVVSGGDLTINGEGAVAGGTSGAGSWTAVWANGGNVVINGGTYSVGGDSTTTDTTHQNDVIYTKNGGTVVITGGYFENDGTVWTLNENDSTGGAITVYGGTFEKWNPEDNVSEGANTNFVAKGYEAVESSENVWTVQAHMIARLHLTDPATGEAPFIPYLEGNDLAELIKNGKAFYADYYEMALELLDDIELDEGVTIDYPMTIELNGKNISSAGDVFIITDGANVTINGGGKVAGGTSGVGSWTAVWANGGNVTINGGTYSVGGDSSTTETTHQNDVIYTKNGGTVTITGGTFLNDGTVWTLNENDANRGTITVTGGTFYGFNPEENVSEGANTNFLASEKYIAIEESENVFVVWDYVAWIKAELLAGNDVTLERDIVVDGTYIDSIPASTNGNGRYPNYGIINVVGEDVKFDLNGYNITYNGHANFTWNGKTVNSCTVAHGLFFANAGANLEICDSVGDSLVTVNGLASGVYAASPNTVINVTGGSWVNHGCADCGGTNLFLYASHGGEVVISAGNFTQDLDAEGNSYLIVNHNGEYKNSVIDFAQSNITIYGGTFTGMNPEEAHFFQQTADNKLVMGETYNAVAEGYIAHDNGNGSWTVVEGEWVAQVGETKYTTLAAALEAVQDGETILVLKDHELPAALTVTKTVAIALDGHEVTYSSDVAGEAMITNKGNLTLTGEGKINFTYIGEPDSSYGKGNYTISNAGTLTVSGPSIVNSSATMSHACYVIDNNSNNSAATLIIEAGEVINTNNYAIRQVVGNNANTVTINGGNVTGTRAVWMQLAGNDTSKAPSVTLNVNGGTLTATGENGGYKLAVYSYSYGSSLANTKINITGGTLNGDVALTGGANKTAVETVTVTGGKINDLYSYASDELAVPAITLTGGTFNTNYAEYYTLDNGYIFRPNAEGTYDVVEGTYVAAIGDVKYETLEAAVAAAQAGETVTLLDDVTLTEVVTIEQEITLDLGGYTLTGADGAVVLNVKAAATIENGTITGNKSGTSSGLIDIYADLTMDGVTVTTSKINALRFKAGECTATLTDCTVTGAFKGYGGSVWDIQSGTYMGASTSINDQLNGTAAISGGTFHYEIEETECAPGYTVVDNGDGTWTVKYAPACFIDANNNGVLDEGEAVYASLEPVFANHKEGDVYVVLTADIAAKTQVDTDVDAHYYFSTNVAGGAKMDFLFADDWNYVQKMTVGENITLTAPYLLAWTELNINGKADVGYAYFQGADVTVAEGAELNVTTGSKTVQVKNGANLTVNGTLNAGTLNVWVSDAKLTVSGENAKVDASWIDIWDGTPSVVVENGATLTADNMKASRGGTITVDAATLDVVVELGHNGESKGEMTILNDGTIAGANLTTIDSTVTGPEGLTTITTDIADHKVVYEEGVYKVVPKVYVAETLGVKYETLEEALEAAEGKSNIVVNLLADATLDITAWDTLAIGGDATSTITINGNGNTLTFNKLNSDWNNVATNNGAKLILNNMTINDSGYNNGPWNRYDINFACPVELNNVTSTKALAFKDDAVLNTVTINESGDNYAIWIQANGQTVTIDGLDVNSAGRGIKIDEQYVDAAVVNLTVKNADFDTAKKGAIMVKSSVGANITVEKVDISGVAADTTNVVWNDEDAAVHYGKVKVEGGTKIQEGKFAVAIIKDAEVWAYYKTLSEAVEAVQAGESIELVADIELTEAIELTKSIVLDQNRKKLTGNDMIVLGEDVTLTTADTLTDVVTTNVEDYKVEYNAENGWYELVEDTIKVTVYLKPATAAWYNGICTLPEFEYTIEPAISLGILAISPKVAEDVEINGASVYENAITADVTVINKDYEVLEVVPATLTVVPAVASFTDTEGNTEYYADLKSFESNMRNGTVTLLKDVTVSETLEWRNPNTISSLRITFDLNGHTLTRSGDGSLLHVEYCRLTLKNGEMIGTECQSDFVHSGIGSLTIEDAVLMSMGTTVNTGWVGNLDLRSGKIISTRGVALVLGRDGNIRISGGEITGYQYAMRVSGSPVTNMKITGGVFTGNYSGGVDLSDNRGVIEGGLYSGPIKAAYIADGYAAVEITTEGEYKGYYEVLPVLTVTITPETAEMVEGNAMPEFDYELSKQLADDAYTFTIAKPVETDVENVYTVSAEVTAPGYAVTVVPATLTVVPAVARVDETNYASVQDALNAAAQATETVTVELLTNVTEDVTVSGKVELAAGECTLTGTITVNEGASLAIVSGAFTDMDAKEFVAEGMIGVDNDDGTVWVVFDQIPVTVTIDDAEMFLGDELPEFTFTAVTADGVDVSEIVTMTYTVNDGEEVTEPGEYEINAVATMEAPYVATVVPGKLTVLAGKPQIVSTARTLLLQGMIYINQYIAFENFDLTIEEIVANGGMEIECNKNGVITTYTVPLEYSGVYDGKDEFRAKTNGIPVKEMGDVMIFRPFVTVDGEKIYAEEDWEYSVRIYCESRIEKSSNAKLKSALAALLNYGAEAQKYFGYKTDDLMNASLQSYVGAGLLQAADLELNWTSDLLTAVKHPSEAMCVNFAATDTVTSNGTTLNLKSTLYLTYYMGVGMDGSKFEDATEHTFYFWTEADYAQLEAQGVALTKENASYTRTANLEYSGAQYGYEYVANSNAFYARMYGDTVYTVLCVVDSDGVEHCSGVMANSPEGFAANKLNDGKTAQIDNVMKWMVVYGERAKIYLAD